jgi:tRNA (guanine37-N1)-methyltransferase
LQAVLPDGVEIPSSFESVGHIAHFNLRPPHLPYKHIIGQVCIDKNPSIKTVVTKVKEIENEFRVFDMEVIAGTATNVNSYTAEV